MSVLTVYNKQELIDMYLLHIILANRWFNRRLTRNSLTPHVCAAVLLAERDTYSHGEVDARRALNDALAWQEKTYGGPDPF